MLFKYGLNRFKKETDIIEIIKSVRLLKILAKILLSNNQIKLLALENSNLLCKDLRVGSNNEYEIVQNQNGIKMRSTASMESPRNQDEQNLNLEESIVEIAHDDLPRYLSSESDNEFKQKIDKIVSEFGNQENNPQNNP